MPVACNSQFNPSTNSNFLTSFSPFCKTTIQTKQQQTIEPSEKGSIYLIQTIMTGNLKFLVALVTRCCPYWSLGKTNDIYVLTEVNPIGAVIVAIASLSQLLFWVYEQPAC